MHWKGFQRPKRIEVDQSTLTPTFGRFIAQPFERGFATTVGNAMRRCLLSSIEGAAITAVNIEGALHEFSSIVGVKEDVSDIILNLKQIPILLHADESKFLSVDTAKAGDILASELSGDGTIEVCDGSVHVATLNEQANLKLQAQVSHGRGYASAEDNFDESMGIGWIPVDSVHSPVKRVNYTVEAARLGRTTDYERLILEVWTNGTITPVEAISLSATLLKEHLTLFIESETAVFEDAAPVETTHDSEFEAILSRNIDELDLSVRSANCLKNANIHTIRDLVRRSEKEMLETKNFGRKSLVEVTELLESLGLRFGMDVPEAAAPVA